MDKEPLGRRDCYFRFSVAERKGASKECCILKDSSVAFLVLFFSFPLNSAELFLWN